jgi:hypothetical protein
MAWSDGILIIYIVNLFANKQALTERFNRLCDWCCTQHLTHTRSGKRHVEPAVGWLCVLRFNSEKSVIVAALTLASPMTGFGCLMLGLIRAVSGRKLHNQILCAISLSHDSHVMSTICQSPRACRDDFQQLLPSRMD